MRPVLARSGRRAGVREAATGYKVGARPEAATPHVQIARHTVVTFEYTLFDPEGRVIDSSADSGPLTYVHGARRIVPGLEAALEGYAAGDELRVTVPPESAYGFHDPDRVDWLPVTALDPEGKVEVGMRFEAETERGIEVATVTEIVNGEARVDANHPLAGLELVFEVRIVSVRPASGGEIVGLEPPRT